MIIMYDMNARIYLLIIVCGLLAFCVPAHAQSSSKVKWTMTVEALSDGEGLVTVKAVPGIGWHLYGSRLPQGGPKPTTIDFGESTGVELIGELIASPQPTEVYDPLFDMNITLWEKSVTFTQRVKIIDPAKALIAASITFMACNDVNCTPPTTITLTQKF